MRVRTISALCAVIAVVTVAGAVFLTGCASGHKQFAYVVGQGTNEVFEFREDRSGTLTPLGSPNFPAGSNPAATTVHTSGDFLYVADFAGNDVTLLDINASNGNLSVPVSNSIVAPVNPPNIFSAGAGPIALAMSPKAPFLYVANQASGDISVFTVDPGAGGLGGIAGSPFKITPASNPSALAISPKGDFLYVANSTQGTVAGFAIGADGKLTSVGAPLSLGVGATPNSITVEHSGRFVYVADTAHNSVQGFSIQGNGTLAAITGSPFAAGALPSAVASDPQGALLFAANSGSNNVSAYVIDANSGALGQVSGSPFATGGAGPSALAVDANNTMLYVTDATTHDIAGLAILSNGALAPVKGSPFPVATAAFGITMVQR